MRFPSRPPPARLGWPDSPPPGYRPGLRPRRWASLWWGDVCGGSTGCAGAFAPVPSVSRRRAEADTNSLAYARSDMCPPGGKAHALSLPPVARSPRLARLTATRLPPRPQAMPLGFAVEGRRPSMVCSSDIRIEVTRGSTTVAGARPVSAWLRLFRSLRSGSPSNRWTCGRALSCLSSANESARSRCCFGKIGVTSCWNISM